MPHRKTSSSQTVINERPSQVPPVENAPLFSPCCKKCKLLPDNTCGGCGRTIMEIALWKNMPKAQRDSVLERLHKAGFDL